jgi:tryptophan-rich sensory protein
MDINIKIEQIYPTRKPMAWTIFKSILLVYSILILVNIPASLIRWEFENEPSRRLWYQPPGVVIPIVWFVLFNLLGFARYTLLQASHASLQGWLFGLAFLCATYAYYTLGLVKLTQVSALWLALFGNIAVIVFAAFTTASISKYR